MPKVSWPNLPVLEVKEISVDKIKETIVHQLHSHLAKDRYVATPRDFFLALSYSVREFLVERWIKTQQNYHKTNPKRAYYISMEFLIGRTLENSLINLEIYDKCKKALSELGLEMSELIDLEWDAALGNGGLGRLAACFLDSMATLNIPAHGYGLRYDYGIFFQHLVNGYQVEYPDNWLRYGNPWEIPRPEYLYPIHFGGRVIEYHDSQGGLHNEWVDTQEVMAMAYDTPVPGYDCNTVNSLRLWSARSSRGFELNYFQDGDYMNAVQDKVLTENITRVLYPNDSLQVGRELRLKQEYFLVSATMQDILRRFKKSNKDLNSFPEKSAIQLNDTHPSLAIPELMRLLMDQEKMEWDKAWRICSETFSYTNHTIMPEALEKWSVALFERLLPRHLQIIYEINSRWLKEVSSRFPGDNERLKRMSIIEEGEKKMIRMAYLSLIGSHYVNGVSALHSKLIKEHLFEDFYDVMPLRFTNKTNGITPRRWLKQCNQDLAKLITTKIGTEWPKKLDLLQGLVKFAEDKKFQEEWIKIKKNNKERLAEYVESSLNICLNTESIFDVQIKRLHEYKRQLMNALHIIALYNRIKDNPEEKCVPRTFIFAGKAAPAYFMAKLIIKFINNIGEVINHDPQVGNKLKVVFLENYRVSLAELIIPATELSEQISTAGTEASGTGNMKFALNGALTIGTLDGANIEIKEEVGDENIFIFGHKTNEILELKSNGYNPLDYYHNNDELKRILDQIRNGYFSPEQHNLFEPIVHSLLEGGDNYCLLADFGPYSDMQRKVSEAYKDKFRWNKSSIINVAKMGKFSSDRTIKEYAEEIWDIPTR
jgi:glycogen phosphorylase